MLPLRDNQFPTFASSIISAKVKKVNSDQQRPYLHRYLGKFITVFAKFDRTSTDDDSEPVALFTDVTDEFGIVVAPHLWVKLYPGHYKTLNYIQNNTVVKLYGKVYQYDIDKVGIRVTKLNLLYGRSYHK